MGLTLGPVGDEKPTEAVWTLGSVKVDVTLGSKDIVLGLKAVALGPREGRLALGLVEERPALGPAKE